MAAKNDDLISLNEWLLSSHSDEELQELFVGISKSCKNLNTFGFAVRSFNPNDIFIDSEDLSAITFGFLRKMPSDYTQRREIVSKEIFVLTMMQIGIYTNCLNYMSAATIKDNFSSFIPFLPEENINYYKRIIDDYHDEKVNCVYFCDYVAELGQRLQDRGQGVALTKNNGAKRIDVEAVNSSSAAYVNFVIIPIAVVLTGLLLTFISWFVK